MAANTVLTGTVPKVVGSVVLAGVGVGFYSRYLRSVAHADNGAPPKAFGGGPAFLSLRLQSSEAVNHNTKKLRFALPTEDHISGLPLTYEKGVIEFLVKKYPDGKQSTHLHSLKPGDSLRFVMPIPGYKWAPRTHHDAENNKITLIAGGAGITPMYQLIQGILHNPEDRTGITLVFGVNTDADVLLRPELETLERSFPGRFRVVYTVSNPAPGSPFRKGYVTKDLLREVAGPAPTSAKDGGKRVFVCGPPAMEAALVGNRSKPGILGELGYTKDQIHRF